MKHFLLLILICVSFNSFSQTRHTGLPAKKAVLHGTHKKITVTPLTTALMEMKDIFKDKIAEHNDYVTAFVIQAYRPKIQYMYEVEEMLDKVPTNQESRDMLLIALARRSGNREEMIIEQLHVLGVSIANARLIAAYTAKLDY